MIVLLPCYSLEDFSIYRTAKDSFQIFSAWTALYHPALIDYFQKMPGWERGGNPSWEARRLIVVPPCCEPQLQREWVKKMEEKGAVIIRHLENREEILAEILEKLNLTENVFPEEEVETFLSLGFCHFVSELYSRKLRYMSNLDTQNFAKQTQGAVQAWKDGDVSEYQAKIRRAFEILAEAKEYFFPTAMKLLDLTWLNRSSLGEPLEKMLLKRRRRDESTNLALPTFYLDLLREELPSVFALLKEEIQSDRVTLVGGDEEESPLYLLPQMEIASRIIDALAHYEDAFQKCPTVFGRSMSGLTPVLPQLLRLTGYRNGLFFTRDGKRSYRKDQKVQSRVLWEGSHASVIETLARLPEDAETSKAFMELPDRVGYSNQGDAVLTATYEHLPNREAPWLGDIFRMSRFAPVLGETSTLPEYFQKTEGAGEEVYHGKDAFRTNFLTRAYQDKRPLSVSAWQAFYRLGPQMNSLSFLSLFAVLASPRREFDALPQFDALSTEAGLLEEWKTKLSELLFHPTPLALAFDDDKEREKASETIEKTQKETAEEVIQIGKAGEKILAERLRPAFAKLLYGELTDSETKDSNSSERGVWIVNPVPFAKKIALDSWTEIPPELQGQTTPRRRGSVPSPPLLEIPPLSALWLKYDAQKAAEINALLSQQAERETPIKKDKKGFFNRFLTKIRGAEEPNSETMTPMVSLRTEKFTDGETDQFYAIRNRHFEVRIDAVTGETRAVRTFSQPTLSANRGILRQPAMGNRLGWQIALRLSESQRAEDGRPEESGNFGYSMMAATNFEILSDGPYIGQLRITGTLMTPSGEKAADFEEILTAEWESPIIRAELTLRPVILPEERPWENYYGVRFAWNDDLANIRVGVHETIWRTERDYLQAPEFVDIRSEKEIGITILSGGLPFFRRYGLKQMDAVLIPARETERTFSWGIGVDLNAPIYEGNRFLAPDPIILPDLPAPKHSFLRFLEWSPESIAVLLLEPIYDFPFPAADTEKEPEKNEHSETDSQTVLGFRVVLQETTGRAKQGTFKTPWELAAIVQTDLLRRKTGEIPLADAHSFTVELEAHQILPLEILFR